MILRAGDRLIEADAIVFDKDGTLLDFDALWAGRTRRWFAQMLAQVGAADELERALHDLIGLDWAGERVVPDGPLAVAALDKLYVLAAGLLYRHAGLLWPNAEALATSTGRATLAAQPTPAEILPLGPVALTLQQLHAAGVRLGVLTSDDRAGTQHGLRLLGVYDLLAGVVCAGDGLPHKPDPAGLYQLSKLMGVPVGRMVMVGDSVSDMQTGRNAGVVCCIGIAGASADPQRLQAVADLLLPSVAAIRPAAADSMLP